MVVRTIVAAAAVDGDALNADDEKTLPRYFFEELGLLQSFRFVLVSANSFLESTCFVGRQQLDETGMQHPSCLLLAEEAEDVSAVEWLPS